MTINSGYVDLLFFSNSRPQNGWHCQRLSEKWSALPTVVRKMVGTADGRLSLTAPEKIITVYSNSGNPRARGISLKGNKCGVSA